MEERSESAFKRVGTYDLYACIGQGSFATKNMTGTLICEQKETTSTAKRGRATRA